MNEFTRESLSDYLAERDVDQWSIESFHDAVNIVYAGITEGEKPSEEYLQLGIKTARMRIALAGYRLADLLNEIYGSAFYE